MYDSNGQCHPFLLSILPYYLNMYFLYHFMLIQGFPGGSDGKASACSAGDPGSGLGRSPGEGNGNPLLQKDQFSFQSQRKARPKNAHTTTQLHSYHTLAK